MRVYKTAVLATILVFAMGGCSFQQKNSAGTAQAVESTEAKSIQLQDGEYLSSVTLEGGSGKASVSSPAQIQIEDGQIKARITWSSPYYDYMLVEGEKYLNEEEDPGENSVFSIPVPSFDEPFTVVADTTAMSRPHEIEYTLTFGQPQSAADVQIESEHAGTEKETAAAEKGAAFSVPEIAGLTLAGQLDLSYAQQFSVSFYHAEKEAAGMDAQDPSSENEGITLIAIGDMDRFLLIPEGMRLSKQTQESLQEKGIVLLKKPIERTYLVSTSVMDMVRAVDALDRIRFSGTKQKDWSIQEAAQAMENKEILYAGKYSAPDYELLVGEDCRFAIENTMIYHNPSVKEKLESLGIPVLVERSSYEPDPLGRLEWIRLYGILFDRQETADTIFREQVEDILPLLSQEKTGKTLAFFSVNTSGSVTVRKPGDYITKLIGMAGGRYVFDTLNGEEEGTMSTMNMQMEDFYAGARDADILIYNATIEGELGSTADLLAKSPLFQNFKAVQEGQVYCLASDCFQHSTMTGQLLQDLYAIIHGEEKDAPVFIKPVGNGS